MQPNWFVAWPVTLEPSFALPHPPDGVRLFHPADRHITAVFLGPCDEAVAVRVFDEAKAVSGPVERATLGDFAALGNPRRPSALCALVDEGSEPLTAVMATHRDPWRALAGLGPEGRSPLPHCTLGRVTRRATEAQREGAVDWGSRLRVRGVALEVAPLALYTWSEDRRERLFRIWS